MQCWRSWVSAAVLVLTVPAAMAQVKPRDRYAEVNGVKLHYMEAGSKGPCVIFLHGFPEFWYEWKDVISDFGADHHVIALDMRGYNLSAKPEGVDQYKLPLLVEDVRAVAESAGMQKFTLVGHGWGGVVAWAFASAHPEKLDFLVTINAPHPTIFARELAKDPAQQKANAGFRFYAGDKAEATLGEKNFERLEAMMGKFASDRDRKEYMNCWKRGLTGALNHYRAAATGEMVPMNPIAVHTMVIWGDEDRLLLPGNLEGLDQYVKTLTVKRIPGASHWVVREKPHLVIAYIRDFIRP